MNGVVVYSIVVPVYNNAGSIPHLIARLNDIALQLEGTLEAVFVVDGSPDNSYDQLVALLPDVRFATQVLQHSRNFGSFAAVRTGMEYAKGDYIAVMAADLQEPPELVLDFFRILSSGAADITIGRRESRDDPPLSRWSATVFWRFYRKVVFPDMPPGGVDIFACNRAVASEILKLQESRSSLVGLLFWVGFRRAEVPYQRRAREHGQSGWSFSKKVRYLLDSIFSFTDLPLSILVTVGFVGGALTLAAAVIVSTSYLLGSIQEPGYTPLMLVILFSTFSLLSALGIVGSYVWRAFENTKQRPSAIVMSRQGDYDRASV